MVRSLRLKLVMLACGVLLALVALSQQKLPELAGRVAFPDPRNPPPWTEVHAAALRDFELGRTLFNARWQPAGHADAERRSGLGPLFVEDSCDACHDDGARGRPPAAPGEHSNSFVMQLGGTLTPYGLVLQTRAIEGHVPEGRIVTTFRERTGRYADGQPWTLRQPRYAVTDPSLGRLPARAVLKPRIAPALFGDGLLDAVQQPVIDAIREAQPRHLRGNVGGRFGWQGDAISLVDQTAIAFAREMGLTSEPQPRDDCTAAQVACREAVHGPTP